MRTLASTSKFEPSTVLEELSLEQQRQVFAVLDDRIGQWRHERYKEFRNSESQLQSLLDERTYLELQIENNDKWFETKGKENLDNGPNDVNSRRQRAREFWERKQQLDSKIARGETAKENISQLIEALNKLEAQEFELQLKGLLLPYVKDLEHKQLLEKVQRARSRRKDQDRKHREAEQQQLQVRYQEFLRRQERNASEKRERAQEKIRAICEKRGVNSLYHFTPFDNVNSILSSGLVSRFSLEAQKINVIKPDPYRLDGWENWISISISFPNDKLFYVFRRRLPNLSDWVLVSLSPALLWEQNCRFMPTNAAATDRRMFSDDHWSSEAAFEQMFLNEHMRQDVPKSFCTDPQAEVMVEEHVPARYIKSLVVRNSDVRFGLENLSRLPVEVDPSLFEDRCDNSHWRDGQRVPFD
jgi:hypothetical protein